ncbi:MAG: ABC transporter ATP-binding protein [Chloroflexi bacterium]|nr:ABC transporter ATP-binding protein [Chloroflexota bacterium]
MSRSLLELDDVRWSPGGHHVLRGITLAVEAGEMVAVIGPTGSGKSTLLRILGRLLRPSSGSVRVEGRDAWSLAPGEIARRIAFLPQSPEAAADLTVEELAWHGRYPHQRGLARALGGARPADRAAVEAALEQAGIRELRAARLGELSGGEQRRAWIALVLAQQADLLLLDEPTAFLDIGHQLELLTLLRQLNEQSATTTVMALHDLGYAGSHATRVVALSGGAVVADGEPERVLTSERLSALYGVAVTVLASPAAATGVPIVVPTAGARRPHPEPGTSLRGG